MLSAIFKNNYFSRLIQADGRLIVAFSVCMFFLMFSWAYYKSYHNRILWELGIPVTCCPFFDLRVITAGLDSFQQGNDPLAAFPKNTSMATMYNYPRAWYYFSYLGVGEEHTVFLGCLLSLLFFVLVFKITGRITFREGIIYSFIVCSPSVLFLIERGNCDIVIFILLAMLCILPTSNLISKLTAGIIFLLACALKLYPIFSIGLFLKLKRKAFFITSFVLVSVFIFYVLNINKELSLIRDSTPRALVSAFGAFVLSDNLLVNQEKAINGGALAYELNPATISMDAIETAHLLTLAVIVCTGLIIFFYTKYRSAPHTLDVSKIDMFRIGAGIYMGVYLLGNNWDYRLAFLIFTLPQVIIWCKTNNFIKHVSIAALMGIGLSLWNPFIYKFLHKILLLEVYFFVGLGIEEMINFFLFGYFFFTCILTLPEWMKTYIFLQPVHSPGITNNTKTNESLLF